MIKRDFFPGGQTRQIDMNLSNITNKLLLVLVCSLLLLIYSPGYGQNIEYVSSTLWTNVNDICIENHFAYCAFEPGFAIFDISNISNPELLSELYLTGDTRRLFVQGNYAFVIENESNATIKD